MACITRFFGNDNDRDDLIRRLNSEIATLKEAVATLQQENQRVIHSYHRIGDLTILVVRCVFVCAQLKSRNGRIRRNRYGIEDELSDSTTVNIEVYSMANFLFFWLVSVITNSMYSD